MEEKKNNIPWHSSKDKAAIFFDNESIQTAVQSSIPLALFGSKLSTEIQFENTSHDSVTEDQSQSQIQEWKVFLLVFY